MKNYRIIEIILGTDEVCYEVQRETKTLFGKTKWESYYEPEDMCCHYEWTSYKNGGTRFSSIRDAKNIIAGFGRNELRKEIKSIRVLTDEEINSCC